MLYTAIVSDQYKIFPETEPGTVPKLCPEDCTCFSDEPFSFQLCLRWDGGGFLPVSVSAESVLPVSAYRVGFVPVSDAASSNPYGEAGYEAAERGQYPDLLLARPACPEIVNDPSPFGGRMYTERDTAATVNLTKNGTQTLYFTVNEEKQPLAAGTWPLTVRVTELNGNTVLYEETVSLTVLGAELDKERPLYYTNWFHCDCLSDLYRAPVYGERFWEIFRSFVKNAARHSMNTLLTPCFTPPLDTIVGRERMNVQLVDVTVTAEGYRFGFDRLRTFIREAKACGIRYFEHSHFFSQWGAKHAPNIYAQTENGYERIFGWETDAAGEDYRAFLAAYIPAFLAFAEEEGIADRLVFHISDEPSKSCEENYRLAADGVRKLLGEHITADALSDYLYYEKGLVQTPIASVDHAADFEGRCPHYWLYYTCGAYARSCPNRLITNTAARTRILGAQLYLHGAEGFLHWGYNNYYDRLSVGIADPMTDPCGYKGMPGASFLVYPGTDGNVIPSIREQLMDKAMCDCRALRTAERYLGADRVRTICVNALGGDEMTRIPADDAVLRLRRDLCRAVKDALAAEGENA